MINYQQWTNIWYFAGTTKDKALERNDTYKYRVAFKLPLIFPITCVYMVNNYFIADGSEHISARPADMPFTYNNSGLANFQYIDEDGDTVVAFLTDITGYTRHIGIYLGW